MSEPIVKEGCVFCAGAAACTGAFCAVAGAGLITFSGCGSSCAVSVTFTVSSEFDWSVIITGVFDSDDATSCFKGAFFCLAFGACLTSGSVA